MAERPVPRERGISYSPPMVLARNAGIKTQTRRIAKISAPDGYNLGFSGIEAHHLGGGRWALVSRGAGGAWEERAHAQCPYGVVGDRLYVREACRYEEGLDSLSPAQIAEACLDAGYTTPWAPIRYEADGTTRNWKRVGTPTSISGGPMPGRYRHARFMPRWASRGLDEITDVRLQRLLSISHEDAPTEGLMQLSKDEGRTFKFGIPDRDGLPGHDDYGWDWYEWHTDPVQAYRLLWEKINGAGSWDVNPWVWAITFKRVEPAHAD
jgi:hypothetical protein